MKKASQIEKEILLKTKSRAISNFNKIKINFNLKHKEKVIGLYLQNNTATPTNNAVFQLKNGGHVGFTMINKEWFYQFKDYSADKGFFESGEWYSFGRALTTCFDEVMDILTQMEHVSVSK